MVPPILRTYHTLSTHAPRTLMHGLKNDRVRRLLRHRDNSRCGHTTKGNYEPDTDWRRMESRANFSLLQFAANRETDSLIAAMLPSASIFPARTIRL